MALAIRLAKLANGREPKPRIVIALAALSCAPCCGASICSPPDETEMLYFQRDSIEAADVEAFALPTVESVFRARLWRTDGEQQRRALRLYHDYRAFELAGTGAHDVRGRRPQANGHVHRLGVGYGFGTPQWEWALAPMLATSSNVGRHPRAVNGKLVAWHAAIRRRHALSRSVVAFYGVCHDDRFGTLGLRPLIGVHWLARQRLTATLAWPDSQVELRLGKRWRLWAEARPSGGHWHVYDNELAKRSRFSYRGWRMDFGIALETRNHRLAAALGREVERSLRLALSDGSEVDFDAPNARRLSMRWQWLR